MEDYVQQLINLAKNGDTQAEAKLWEMHEADMRKAHDFSRLGLKCKRGTRSKYAQSFEEAMADIYDTFKNAIRLYNPKAGASFKTYLTQKIKFTALDRLNAARVKYKCSTGEIVNVKLVSIDALLNCFADDDEEETIQYSSLEETANREAGLYAGDADLSCENGDFDYAEEDSFSEDEMQCVMATDKMDPTKAKISKVLALFPKGSSKRKLLDAYLQCAQECDGTPTTAQVCHLLGCTRQNYSIQMKAIIKVLLKNGITLTSKAA